MLLETFIRQVDSTTQLLRGHNEDIRTVMLEAATEMVQGAPRSSLAGPSVLMARMEVLAYELLETVDTVRREQYGAAAAAAAAAAATTTTTAAAAAAPCPPPPPPTDEGRKSVGGQTTPPSHERKRMRAADDHVDGCQVVRKAASATPCGSINHDHSSNDRADAGAVHPAGGAAKRCGRPAAAATTIRATNSTAHTTATSLPAPFVVVSNHDLMHHIISFALGRSSVRGMTRLACVSRAWRDAIYSAHELWMDICHHCLPFTMPDEGDEQEEGEEVPVMVKGLLRSAGGYRGVVMQHKEAVWKHDQLRRAQEAEGDSGGGGEKVPGRERSDRPQVLMEPAWFEHMTIIIEVFDRVMGKCMLSMIGRGELANGTDPEDEPDALVLAVNLESVWRKAFRVEEMVAPWDVPWGSEFDDNVHVNTSRYFQQRGRFIARVLGVKRGGGMVVLYALGPNAEFVFNHGTLPQDGDAVHLWVTRSSDMSCAYQMGYPLAASLGLYVRHDSDGVSRIKYASGGLEPCLYFGLTPSEGDTVGGAGTTFGASHFCTAADYMYAALS